MLKRACCFLGAAAVCSAVVAQNAVPPPQLIVRRHNAAEIHDLRYRISFSFYCPVDAYVTDPQGRRAGFDPTTGRTYKEIPNTYYGEDTNMGIAPANPPKLLELSGAVSGEYLLTVVGTARGMYSMEIESLDPQISRGQPIRAFRKTLDGIATNVGVVNTYSVSYDRSNVAGTSLSGGFDGGGQRPKDVNKFLTYANPSQSHTAVSASTPIFPLMIYYGNTVLPATFSATLNGINIAGLFHPTPGGSETVNVNLALGRNVLLLSIDGRTGGRVATDTDTLTLDVR